MVFAIILWKLMTAARSYLRITR